MAARMLRSISYSVLQGVLLPYTISTLAAGRTWSCVAGAASRTSDCSYPWNQRSNGV